MSTNTDCAGQDFLPVIYGPSGGGLAGRPVAPDLAWPELLAHALRVTSCSEDCATLAARLVANQAVACAEHMGLSQYASLGYGATYEGRTRAEAVGHAAALRSLRVLANPPAPPRALTEAERAAIDAEAADAIRAEGRERDALRDTGAEQEAADRAAIDAGEAA